MEVKYEVVPRAVPMEGVVESSRDVVVIVYRQVEVLLVVVLVASQKLEVEVAVVVACEVVWQVVLWSVAVPLAVSADVLVA